MQHRKFVGTQSVNALAHRQNPAGFFQNRIDTDTKQGGLSLAWHSCGERHHRSPSARRIDALELTQAIGSDDAVHHGHLDIEQDDVDRVFESELQRFRAIGDNRRCDSEALQHIPGLKSTHLTIICQQDTQTANGTNLETTQASLEDWHAGRSHIRLPFSVR